METYEKWLSIYLPSVSKRTSIYKGYPISEKEISEAFYLATYFKNRYDWILSILELEINEDEVFETVKDFDFSVLKGALLPNELFSENLFIEKKVAIKVSNQRWVIHQNDADYFPSIPHAHLMEEGLCLNLFDRKVYKGRKLVYTIPKKEFEKIRTAFIQKGIKL